MCRQGYLWGLFITAFGVALLHNGCNGMDRLEVRLAIWGLINHISIKGSTYKFWVQRIYISIEL